MPAFHTPHRSQLLCEAGQVVSALATFLKALLKVSDAILSLLGLLSEQTHSLLLLSLDTEMFAAAAGYTSL